MVRQIADESHMTYKKSDHSNGKPLVLSLFSGCGGLDLGFEQAGFEIGLAYDLREPAITSHNHNRRKKSGFVRDVTSIKLGDLDNDHGRKFNPNGVIGGPPCQSFSRGNSSKIENDPRSKMVKKFFDLALRIHRSRNCLDFIVMENVPEVAKADGGCLLKAEIKRLEAEGFDVHTHVYDASKYAVAQTRRRLILVALKRSSLYCVWSKPSEQKKRLTVKDVIAGLPKPIYFNQSKTVDIYPVHPNHWCMTPKSKKFTDGTLTPGRSTGRSFKTLDWDKPSYTASYGHREVKGQPNCTRRLSVYEALLLQGFPKHFVLKGTLSAQLSQVSEAVPPPLAKAIAQSITSAVYVKCSASKSSNVAA